MQYKNKRNIEVIRLTIITVEKQKVLQVLSVCL